MRKKSEIILLEDIPFLNVDTEKKEIEEVEEEEEDYDFLDY